MERLCFHRCLSVHRGKVYTPGKHPPLGRPPPRAEGHCSVQYMSYWNAFLSHFVYQMSQCESERIIRKKNPYAVQVLQVDIFIESITFLDHTVRFFSFATAIFTCDLMKGNGLYVGLWKCSHGAICSARDAFLYAMSHMTGFHTNSMRL